MFALAWLGGVRWTSTGPDPAPSPILRAPVAVHRPLGLSLIEATEATLDLAREASSPASRIGRELFGLGKVSTGGIDLAIEPNAGPREPAEPRPTPSDVFRSVGERVGAGVGPIAGSARHAFSFLLGPPDQLPAAPSIEVRDVL